MAKSQYLANKLLDGRYGGPAFTPPVTVYIGLFLVAPTSSTSGTEVATASYARAAVPNNSTYWSAASAASKTNALAILFTVAAEDWGLIVDAALFDALTGGNMLDFGALSTSKSILAHEEAEFLAGSIVITDA